MKITIKKTIALFFIFNFLFFSVKTASAENTVLILSSSKIAAFKSCISSVQQTLTGVKTIHLYVKEVPDLQAEIKKNKPSLIITIGTAATKAAQKNTSSIPIVFSFIMNPIKSGYIKSESSSNSNLCGVTMNIPIEDQFNMITRMLPQASKIGVIYSDKSDDTFRKANNIAKALKLKLISKKITSKTEVKKALNELTGKIDILWSVPDATVFAGGRAILLHTVKNRIPFMSFSHQYVKAGALFSLYCDFEDMGKQTAEIALKILNSKENPRNIPLAYPRKELLAINLKVAKLLGITISTDLEKEATLKFK